MFPILEKAAISFQMWQSVVFKCMYKNIIGANIFPWENVHQYLMFPCSAKKGHRQNFVRCHAYIIFF